MKVFICGSLYKENLTNAKDRKDIINAAIAMGRELRHQGFSLSVGVDIKESVDSYVVQGALEAAQKLGETLDLDVYYIKKQEPVPFLNLQTHPSVKIQYHKIDSNEWHVAHIDAIDNSDFVLLMAGRRGTLVSGLVSMLHGVPFVPVASFGGGAQDVLRIAKQRRERYFFNALNENELDVLSAPFDLQITPILIVRYLCRLKSAKKSYIKSESLSQISGIIGMIVGISAYLYCFFKGTYNNIELGLIWLFLASISAGVAGAGIAVSLNLGCYWISSNMGGLKRVLLGIGSGFLAFLILPLVQLISNGSISLTFTGNEYLRYALIAGAAGAYSGICTEAIIKKFIGLMGETIGRRSI